MAARVEVTEVNVDAKLPHRSADGSAYFLYSCRAFLIESAKSRMLKTGLQVNFSSEYSAEIFGSLFLAERGLLAHRTVITYNMIQFVVTNLGSKDQMLLHEHYIGDMVIIKTVNTNLVEMEGNEERGKHAGNDNFKFTAKIFTTL